jgi:hypothetical protein
MAEVHGIFRRVVLGLQHDASKHGIALAAEVASELHLDLCSFFVKEQSLMGLASLPFARALLPFGGGWRPVELDALSQQLDLAASVARRLMAETVGRLGLSCEFEIVDGSLAEAIAAVARSGDIVMISEPGGPAALAAPMVPPLLEAAFGSAAAVMLVPRRVGPRTGPIVVVASDPSDVGLVTASSIAAAAKERVIILRPDQTHYVSPDLVRERATGKPRPAISDLALIVANTHKVGGRLLVVRRDAFDEAAFAKLVSLGKVPVLIVGSDIR